MNINDPIGDMITRIRNAHMRGKEIVDTPSSSLRVNVLEVLKAEGFIRGFSETERDTGQSEIQIELKYHEGDPVIKEIKRSQTVQYLDELDEIIKNNDENFDSLSEEDEALISKSIDLIRSTNKASTSFLQRNFQVGYNKAARIMEALEQRGVVSPPNHAGKRDILINQ